MAENRIDLNIVGKADFTDVTQKLTRLKESIALVNKESSSLSNVSINSAQIENAQKSFINTISAIKGVRVEMVGLSEGAAHLNTRLLENKRSISEMFTTYRQGKNSMLGDIEQIAQYQAKLHQSMIIPSAVKNGQAAVVTNFNQMADQALVGTMRLKAYNTEMLNLTNRMINFGKNTQWAGRQLTVGLTVPLMAAGGAITAMFYQVDQSMRKLVSVYGVGGTAHGAFSGMLPSPQELQAVKDGVMQVSQAMAAMYGQSADQTVSIAADLAAAGYTQQQLLDLTQTVTSAMVLGQTDQQSAIKATIALQNTYRLSTTQTADAIKFFSAAQAATSTSMNDLIDAIPRVGPIMKNLGGSYKDTVAMLVAMKEGGVAAGEGANALKNSLQRIVAPTKTANEQMKQFGVNLDEISKSGSPVLMIEKLQVALNKLDPVARQVAITDLFGKFQAARITALLDNFNRSGTQSAKVMQMMGLSAQELANIQNNQLKALQESPSMKFQAAIQSLKTQLLPIGQKLLELATPLVNGITWLVQAIQNIGPIKYLLAGGLGIAAIAGPIIMFVGLLSNLGGQLFKIVNQMRMFREGFSAGGGLARPFNALKEGIKGTQNYLEDFNAAEYASKKAADELQLTLDDQRNSWIELASAMEKYRAALEGVRDIGRSMPPGPPGAPSGGFPGPGGGYPRVPVGGPMAPAGIVGEASRPVHIEAVSINLANQRGKLNIDGGGEVEFSHLRPAQQTMQGSNVLNIPGYDPRRNAQGSFGIVPGYLTSGAGQAINNQLGAQGLPVIPTSINSEQTTRQILEQLGVPNITDAMVRKIMQELSVENIGSSEAGKIAQMQGLARLQSNPAAITQFKALGNKEGATGADVEAFFAQKLGAEWDAIKQDAAKQILRLYEIAQKETEQAVQEGRVTPPQNVQQQLSLTGARFSELISEQYNQIALSYSEALRGSLTVASTDFANITEQMKRKTMIKLVNAGAATESMMNSLVSAIESLIQQVRSTTNQLTAEAKTATAQVATATARGLAGAPIIPPTSTPRPPVVPVPPARTSPPKPTDSGLAYLATGGKISGPGGPKDDLIPAMLSNGEYVVRADAVGHYGTSFLDSINHRKLAGGGVVRLAEGPKKEDRGRLGLHPIPYETLQWDEKTQTTLPITGVSSVIDFNGRQIVMVDVGGQKVPFYRSTGMGGKKETTTGDWYPFFGIGDSPSGPWINKTTGSEMAAHYGSVELREIAQYLNSHAATFDNMDIPRVKSSGAHIDAINSAFPNPVANNGDPNVMDIVRANIQHVVSSVAGKEWRQGLAGGGIARYDHGSRVTRPAHLGMSRNSPKSAWATESTPLIQGNESYIQALAIAHGIDPEFIRTATPQQLSQALALNLSHERRIKNRKNKSVFVPGQIQTAPAELNQILEVLAQSKLPVYPMVLARHGQFTNDKKGFEEAKGILNILNSVRPDQLNWDSAVVAGIKTPKEKIRAIRVSKNYLQRLTSLGMEKFIDTTTILDNLASALIPIHDKLTSPSIEDVIAAGGYAMSRGGIARFSGVGGKSGFVSGMQTGAHGGYSRAAIESLYASVGRTPPAFPESITETQLKEYLMSPASPFYGYDVEQFFATRQAGETGLHTGNIHEGWSPLGIRMSSPEPATVQGPSFILEVPGVNHAQTKVSGSDIPMSEEEKLVAEAGYKHAHDIKSVWDTMSPEQVDAGSARLREHLASSGAKHMRLYRSLIMSPENAHNAPGHFGLMDAFLDEESKGQRYVSFSKGIRIPKNFANPDMVGGTPRIVEVDVPIEAIVGIDRMNYDSTGGGIDEGFREQEVIVDVSKIHGVPIRYITPAGISALGKSYTMPQEGGEIRDTRLEGTPVKANSGSKDEAEFLEMLSPKTRQFATETMIDDIVNRGTRRIGSGNPSAVSFVEGWIESQGAKKGYGPPSPEELATQGKVWGVTADEMALAKRWLEETYGAPISKLSQAKMPDQRSKDLLAMVKMHLGMQSPSGHPVIITDKPGSTSGIWSEQRITGRTAATGGFFKKFAGGSKISGPGGPKDDLIPAMVSNGEYIVNADAVNHYGSGFMDAVNAKKLANGGIAGYAFGGGTGLQAVSQILSGIMPAMVGSGMNPIGNMVMNMVQMLVDQAAFAGDGFKLLGEEAKPVADGLRNFGDRQLARTEMVMGDLADDGKKLKDRFKNFWGKLKGEDTKTDLDRAKEKLGEFASNDDSEKRRQQNADRSKMEAARQALADSEGIGIRDAKSEEIKRKNREKNDELLAAATSDKEGDLYGESEGNGKQPGRLRRGLSRAKNIISSPGGGMMLGAMASMGVSELTAQMEKNSGGPTAGTEALSYGANAFGALSMFGPEVALPAAAAATAVGFALGKEEEAQRAVETSVNDVIKAHAGFRESLGGSSDIMNSLGLQAKSLTSMNFAGAADKTGQMTQKINELADAMANGSEQSKSMISYIKNAGPEGQKQAIKDQYDAVLKAGGTREDAAAAAAAAAKASGMSGFMSGNIISQLNRQSLGYGGKGQQSLEYMGFMDSMKTAKNLNLQGNLASVGAGEQERLAALGNVSYLNQMNNSGNPILQGVGKIGETYQGLGNMLSGGFTSALGIQGDLKTGIQSLSNGTWLQAGIKNFAEQGIGHIFDLRGTKEVTGEGAVGQRHDWVKELNLKNVGEGFNIASIVKNFSSIKDSATGLAGKDIFASGDANLINAAKMAGITAETNLSDTTKAFEKLNDVMQSGALTDPNTSKALLTNIQGYAEGMQDFKAQFVGPLSEAMATLKGAELSTFIDTAIGKIKQSGGDLGSVLTDISNKMGPEFAKLAPEFSNDAAAAKRYLIALSEVRNMHFESEKAAAAAAKAMAEDKSGRLNKAAQEQINFEQASATAEGNLISGVDVAAQAKKKQDAIAAEEKSLQKQFKLDQRAAQDSFKAQQKADNEKIKGIQKEIDARQKLWDAKQKAIEQQKTLNGLENDIYKARATGSLLDIAKAQDAYNTELQRQQDINKKDAADQADKDKITKVQDKMAADQEAYDARMQAMQDRYDAEMERLQQESDKANAMAANAEALGQKNKTLIAQQMEAINTFAMKPGETEAQFQKDIAPVVEKIAKETGRTPEAVMAALHETWKAGQTWANGKEPFHFKADGSIDQIGMKNSQITIDSNGNINLALTSGQKTINTGVVGKGASGNNTTTTTTATSGVSADRVKAATGGHITGPGTGTSDSIPAMLSDGEYVVKASSVKKYGTGFMDSINRGHYADGGPIRRFADGGTVSGHRPLHEGDPELTSISTPYPDDGNLKFASYAAPYFKSFFDMFQKNPDLGGSRLNLYNGHPLDAYQYRMARYHKDKVSDHAGYAVDVRDDIMTANGQQDLTNTERSAFVNVLSKFNGFLSWGGIPGQPYGPPDPSTPVDEMHVFVTAGMDPQSRLPGITGTDGNPTTAGSPSGNSFGGPNSAAGASTAAAEIVRLARMYKDIPYSFRVPGLPDSDGWGCATSAYWLFKQVGVTLPSDSLSQDDFDNLHNVVPQGQEQPADLLFFHNSWAPERPINHVAVYLGNGEQFNGGNGISGTNWANWRGTRRVLTGGQSYVGSGGAGGPGVSTPQYEKPTIQNVGAGVREKLFGLTSFFNKDINKQVINSLPQNVGKAQLVSGSPSAATTSATGGGKYNGPNGSGGAYLKGFIAAHGVSDPVSRTLFGLGMRESGGNPNETYPSGSHDWNSEQPPYDVGLWQVNSTHMADMHKMFNSNMQAMFDPENNFQYTKFLSNNFTNFQSGWGVNPDGSENWSGWPSTSWSKHDSYLSFLNWRDKYNSYATGGPIYGAGGPTDDKIPAMLSNGEYVVKADSVRRYGVGFMDAINAGKHAGGGFIRHFEAGGAAAYSDIDRQAKRLASRSSSGSSSSSSRNSNSSSNNNGNYSDSRESYYHPSSRNSNSSSNNGGNHSDSRNSYYHGNSNVYQSSSNYNLTHSRRNVDRPIQHYQTQVEIAQEKMKWQRQQREMERQRGAENSRRGLSSGLSLFGQGVLNAAKLYQNLPGIIGAPLVTVGKLASDILSSGHGGPRRRPGPQIVPPRKLTQTPWGDTPYNYLINRDISMGAGPSNVNKNDRFKVIMGPNGPMVISTASVDLSRRRMEIPQGTSPIDGSSGNKWRIEIGPNNRPRIVSNTNGVDAAESGDVTRARNYFDAMHPYNVSDRIDREAPWLRNQKDINGNSFGPQKLEFPSLRPMNPYTRNRLQREMYGVTSKDNGYEKGWERYYSSDYSKGWNGYFSKSARNPFRRNVSTPEKLETERQSLISERQNILNHLSTLPKDMWYQRGQEQKKIAEIDSALSYTKNNLMRMHYLDRMNLMKSKSFESLGNAMEDSYTKGPYLKPGSFEYKKAVAKAKDESSSNDSGGSGGGGSYGGGSSGGGGGGGGSSSGGGGGSSSSTASTDTQIPNGETDVTYGTYSPDVSVGSNWLKKWLKSHKIGANVAKILWSLAMAESGGDASNISGRDIGLWQINASLLPQLRKIKGLNGLTASDLLDPEKNWAAAQFLMSGKIKVGKTAMEGFEYWGLNHSGSKFIWKGKDKDWKKKYSEGFEKSYAGYFNKFDKTPPTDYVTSKNPAKPMKPGTGMTIPKPKPKPAPKPSGPVAKLPPEGSYGTNTSTPPTQPHWNEPRPGGPIRKADGGIIGYASGGSVIGQGTAKSDSIMAKLSNGEYVMQSAAVDMYGVDFMHMINSGRMKPVVGKPKGMGRMPHASDVQSSSSTNNNNVEYNINVNVAGSNSSPDEIAKVVLRTIRQNEKTKMTHRNIG